MVGDNHTISSCHDSVDTSATCRTDLFDHLLQLDDNIRDSSNDYKPAGSMNTRLSLEAIRQDELRSQAIVNALNQFILQAGNIYKGNTLSESDSKRLREAANEAGLSIKVVDALIEQTADQNAIVDYCMTSDDVFARKMKEDPQLSRVLIENGESTSQKANGLNVSNSVWRIFMHKIIKQFLKEQNMQLTDIIEKSSHTRRLYEEALRVDSKQNIFDTSRIVRDYSEERKRVFITEAEAKQARMEASEAMVKFQQHRNPLVYDMVNGNSEERKHVFITEDEAKQARIDASEARVKFQQHRNPFVYDLVNGTSIQNHHEFPMSMQQTVFDTPDSRDDELSIATCTSERDSPSVKRIELNKRESSDLISVHDLDAIPCAKDRTLSSIQTESFTETNKENLRNSFSDALAQKLSPSLHEIDQERNMKLMTSPSTPKREILETRATANTSQKNESSAVKRRILMYESGSLSPQPNEDSTQKINESLNQDSFPSGNVLQARALFEKKMQQPKAVEVLDRKRTNKNIQNVLATWTQKEQESIQSSSQMGTKNQIVGVNSKVEKRDISTSKNIQHVLATWTQKEQESLRSSSQMGTENQIIGVNSKVEKKSISTGKKIQHVLATWTQKEQESLRSSSQMGTENQIIRVNCTVEKNDVSKEYLRGVENHSFVVEDANDAKGSTRTPKSHHRDLVPGNKTKPRKSIECETKASITTSVTEVLKTRIEQLPFNDTQESQNELKQKSVKTRNKLSLSDENSNESYNGNGGSNDNDDNNDSENVLRYMSSPLHQNLELYPTSKPDDTEQLHGPHMDCECNQLERFDEALEDHEGEIRSKSRLSTSQTIESLSQTKFPNKLVIKDDYQPQQSERFDKTLEDHEGEVRSKSRLSTPQTIECLTQTKFPNKLVIKDDYQSQQGRDDSSIFHKITDARDGLYFEAPLFGNSCRQDKKTILIDEDLHGSLAYLRSSSDDSSRIPIPPLDCPSSEASAVEQKIATTDIPERMSSTLAYLRSSSDDSNRIPIPPLDCPLSEGSAMEQKSTTSIVPKRSNSNHHIVKEKRGRTAHHTTSTDPFALTEVSNENKWADFESNNSFRAQSDKCLELQDSVDHTESERNGCIGFEEVKSVEMSNHHRMENPKDHKTWAHFKSKNLFHQQSEEFSMPLDNMNNVETIRKEKNGNTDSFSHFPHRDSTAVLGKNEINRTTFGRAKSNGKENDKSISLNRQKHKCARMEGEFIEKTDGNSSFHHRTESKSTSEHLEPITSHTNTENQLIVSEPKDAFANFLSTGSSSSVVVKDSYEQKVMELGSHCTEQMNQISMINQNVQSQKLRYRETHFETEENRDEDWEIFTSNFDFKSHRADCVANESGKNRVLDDFRIREKDCQQLDLNHSQLCLNDGPEKSSGSADASHQMNRVCSPPEIQFMSQSSNLAGNKAMDYVKTENRLRANSSCVEESEATEDYQYPKLGPSFTSEDLPYYEGLETNSEGISLRNSSDLGDGYDCSDKTANPIMLSFPSRYESTHDASGSGEGSNFNRDTSNGGCQDDSVNVFNNTYPLPRENGNKNMARGGNHSIISSNCNAIRSHDREIGDFLEQQGDALEKCIEEKQHPLEQFANNIQQLDDIKEKRDHLEALHEFLAGYHFGEKREGSTLKEGQLNVHQEINDSNKLEKSERIDLHEVSWPTCKTKSNKGEQLPANSNVQTEYQDCDEKSASTFSGMDQVATVSSNIEEDKSELIDQVAVSWPISKTESNKGEQLPAKSNVQTEYHDFDEKSASTFSGVDQVATVSSNIEEEKRELVDPVAVSWPTCKTEMNEGEQLPAKRNVQTEYQDFDENSASTFSGVDQVATVSSNTEEDEDQLMDSHEISWPDNEAKSNIGESFSVHQSANLQINHHGDQEIGRDFETGPENIRTQSKLYNTRHGQSFDSTIDINKYKVSDSDSNSSEYLELQKEYNPHRSQRHPGPVVRVLDRPLLDLDDGDFLDAIEVERQNSNDSWYEEPGSITPPWSNTQTYQVEHKPDPLPNALPDPSPKGGQRLSIPGSRLDDTTEVPEGATREEINLLNHFIDVASSNFGGNTLSAESELRVRSAALKVGLTSKFVDQLLNQTMKQRGSSDSASMPVSSPQGRFASGLQQTSFHDQESKYNHNDFTFRHDGSNLGVNDFGGDNETYNTADHFQPAAKENRNHKETADNCNVWDSLGKNLGFLASMTARACGVKYHSGRDDASSIVSAISWEEDNIRPSKAGKSQSGHPSKDDDRVEDYTPSYDIEQQNDDRTRQVTFATDFEEEGERSPQESNIVHNHTDTPPRPKITQLV